MLKIQKFIKSINDIEIANTFLQEKKFIRVKKCCLPHRNNSNSTVYIYNYDKHKTKDTDPIGQECNGLILDSRGNVVSISFPRFFRIGENEATNIEWKNALAEKREDGTLVVIYHHKGEWFIQTKDSPSGDDMLPNRKTEFATLVKAILIRKFRTLKWAEPFQRMNKELCFVFELVSPFNKRLTPYEDSDLILLTIYNKTTLVEYTEPQVQEYASHTEFTRPKTKIINSISDAVRWLADMDYVEKGLVIVDKYGRRIKMVNVDYLRFSEIVGTNEEEFLDPKNLLKIVFENKVDDVVLHFPEREPVLTYIEEKIEDITDELFAIYQFNKYMHPKEYARKVGDHSLSSLLLLIKSDPFIELEDEIKKVRPEKLINIIIDMDKKEFERRLEDARTTAKIKYNSASSI
jgi:hypothetical protein